MTHQSEARDASVRKAVVDFSCPECGKELEVDINSLSATCKPEQDDKTLGLYGGYSYRQEWLKQWGFRCEDPEETKGWMYGLTGFFEKHRPRINVDIFEDRFGAWEKMSPVQKLAVVMEFHIRVAPLEWWKDYFIRLDRNAYTESLPCFHHSRYLMCDF